MSDVVKSMGGSVLQNCESTGPNGLNGLKPEGKPETMSQWYIKNNCTHARCPKDCIPYPQPFVWLGDAYCGRCWFMHHGMSAMIPCSPKVCE